MKIHDFLEKTGMTKRFFCKRTGISPTTLSQVLTGNHCPILRIAVAIEDFTGSYGKDFIVTCRDWLSESNDGKKINKRKNNSQKDDKTPAE